MPKFIIAICVFSILVAFLCPTLSLAIVMVDERGRWPKSWPKQLEPYRRQAKTFEVAEGNRLTIYEIRFEDRKEFETIWPAILRLKSEGAALRLVSCSDKSRSATRMGLFDNKAPAVRIFAPPFSTDGRIDIELVTDGSIIDLNRIRLPADTPIVDERMLLYGQVEAISTTESTDIDSLVAQIDTGALSVAAYQTYRNASGTAGREKNIPSEFWEGEIRKLNPIRVYAHRTNIVIVLRESSGVEEGLYVYIPISSYAPRTGDDGFTFADLGHGVYKYRRELQSDASEHFEDVIANGYPVKEIGSSISGVMPPNLNRNLVLYYSFYTSGNQQTVVDISGGNYYGQVHGAEYAEDTILGGTMSFDGDDDYISVPDVYLKEFTFSAWVKTKTDGLNNRRIFLLSDGEHCYALQGNSGEGVGVYVSDGVELNEYDWQLAEDTWTHISVTYDGHTLSIYKNGRLTEAGDVQGSGVKGTLFIGGTDLHRGDFWHGMIDEVALFSRALTAEEVAQLYSMTGAAA